MEFEQLLVKYGAKAREYEKGEIIFHEGANPSYFLYIKSGRVKLVNYNEDGREFIQNYFEQGETFGEPPLLGNFPYPSTGVCTLKCSLLYLTRQHFLQLMDEHPPMAMKLLKILSLRIQQKSIMARDNISRQSPEARIIAFLDFHKSRINKNQPRSKVLIPYTRQEIANFIGLRVETVIRTLSILKTKGVVDIIDHKLHY